MYRRLWFDLHATVLHSEHALARAAQPALILRDGPSPLLASNGTPKLTATPPAQALHTDELSTATDSTAATATATLIDAGAGAAATRLRPGRTLRLPLRTRSPLTGVPLRDLLRRRAYDGHTWCTIDVDAAGLRAITTTSVRDAQPPTSAAWRDADLTATGLETYPGQTCLGYRLHDGVPARFDTAVLHRLIADTGCSHTTACPVVTVVEDGITWLVDQIGDRTPLTVDDGWCHVAHPALRWTAATMPDLGPDLRQDAVFSRWGSHGSSDRCGVCGAVDATTYHELPSMAGYGLDTAFTCSICGSADIADPIFGTRPQPKPWPPQPETQPETQPDLPATGDGTGPADAAAG